MSHARMIGGLVLALGTSGWIGASHMADAPAGAARAVGFDVAMNGLSFSFEGDVNENGAPATGTPFVIEGYIYPEGTFDMFGDLSGVNIDGSPEFPELVMGTWICRGWHLLDGDAETGAVVATTQIFDFSEGVPGNTTIVSEGIELADFDVPFLRTITGGTGRFAGVSGQHRQVYVGNGLNITDGFNTSFRFRLADL